MPTALVFYFICLSNRLCVDIKAKETLGRRTDLPMEAVNVSNTEERRC